MMHGPEQDDRRISELFQKARRSERDGAPAFEQVRGIGNQTRRRGTTGRRSIAWGFAAAALVGGIGAAAVWLAAPSGPEPTGVRVAETRERVQRRAALPEEPVVVTENRPGTPESPPSPLDRAPSHTAPAGEPTPPPAAVVTKPPPPQRRPIPSRADLATSEGAEVPGGAGEDVTATAPVPASPTLAERVEVTANTDTVVLETTSVAAKFSEEHIQEQPVPGRVYQNVITLAPGVEDTDGDGNPNVHGSRDRDFKAEVSGVSSLDPLTGRSMSEINPKFIEAMEVVTAESGVEFSRARGGFAKLVSGDARAREGVESWNTEGYDLIEENGFLQVGENPLSTFSIDVDTASYSNVRRFLTQGQLPPRDAVRIEELINYFNYDYPEPSGDAPFSATVEVADCPWNPAHRLARIGLRGREISRGDHAGSNLVFLLDVSGSMAPQNKLPLLKSAMALLVEQLTGRDQVAIVVYAGASGLVLPATSGDSKAEILDALDRLQAGGSTNGGAGLDLAYRIARENFIPGGINRVILATDGDFNIGVTQEGELLRRLKADADRGIFLTALGFGYGNYKDDRLEALADKGNGNHAYIDSLREARKVLVEELHGTLVTIAKDVKIQVEFNPLEVGAYRLIGYENRMLAKEDFNDDKKDAGEIGAGHTVTALYELVPPGETEELPPAVDPLKYQRPSAPSKDARKGELFTLKLRYKEPEGSTSRQLEFPITDDGLSLDAATDDFKLAAAVAQFGMLLRDSKHKGAASWQEVDRLAADGARKDAHGHRAEFYDLVQRARGLAGGE